MRSRLVTVVAVLLAAAAVLLVVRHVIRSPSNPRVARASLPSSLASYLGVYQAGAPRNGQPPGPFAATAGQRPNLVGYYSGWAESFATSFADANREQGAVTVVQIDPTDTAISAIAAGTDDNYLRSFADSVRIFGHPVVIGFGHEMNATWYPWGYRHVPAPTFVAAWRHLVSLFRAAGADNVTWLWTINVDLASTGPITSWWPGPDYVTWVGIDGYFYRPTDTFASVFSQTISQVRTFTSKPVLLAETAVGPAAGQPAKISDLFSGMRRYRTLGLVWFDIAQHRGIYHQDWRIEDSPAAAAVFRREASGMTLARPRERS